MKNKNNTETKNKLQRQDENLSRKVGRKGTTQTRQQHPTMESKASIMSGRPVFQNNCHVPLDSPWVPGVAKAVPVCV